jgi:3-hydroxybutyrate dehydrogenase
MEKSQKFITIVTGGGKGIGRAIALRMAEETPVMVVGRTEETLRETVRLISERGGEALYRVGDVAHGVTAERAVELAHSKGYTVRNLVCNAGIGKAGLLHTFDVDLWKRMFDVNVHGSFYFTQACLPDMLHSGRGAICYISSVAGLKAYKGIAAYTATKHALIGLARSVAVEYGKRGIVSVPICPGFVESDMTDRSIASVMGFHRISEEEAREKIMSTNPQHRIFQPEEVAATVAFVCSGQAGALSGAPLVLGGGEV